MAFCEKCGVNISEPRHRCVLCGGDLKDFDGNGEYVFPNISTKSKIKLA